MSNIESWKSAIKDSYTKFELINPARAKTELGFANQLFQSNPQLQKCTTESIVNAVVNVARTSITLNPVMRLAYLVPRGDKCVLDFSYMGMVAMLKDNNCIKTIDAKIVYEDEDFDYDMSSSIIHHKPNYAKSEIEHNQRVILGCYSRAVLPTNDVVYEFMPMWEIDKIKQSSTNSNSKYSAWTTWRDEMIKKSVIKRHFKMLISLGNINNEKISAFMQIENENNPLKNNFNNQPKSSIKNSFIEETEIINEDSDILEDNNIDDFPNIFMSQDNVNEYNINDDDELQELFKDK
jgi:recombination protein RecT